MKPRLLDLFCGAGGAAMGYHRAGFEVVGVDILPMKDYPFEFIQDDALRVLTGVSAMWRYFDAIHASPPCQAYSQAKRLGGNNDHPDLLGPTRMALRRTGLPYVIENVEGAPLRAQLMLCGTMFGLAIIRHRWFEANWSLSYFPPFDCNHDDVYDPWHGGPGERSAGQFREAMGIDWIRDTGGHRRRGTLSEAIPPPYTEWIGRQWVAALQEKAS